ncbi:MAG: hypothetical protein P4L53_05185 [Candidatus Obscuribacterales bacterium]|nr:hypothetical protein [Candidatus Obscuribacterales bacterium]
MTRIQGSLSINRNNSAASFSGSVVRPEVLPWHRLETKQATEAFLRRFKPPCRETTSDKFIYEIDCDAEEVKRWFDEVAYSTAELLRAAATLADQSGDLIQSERLYLRLLRLLEKKTGQDSTEVADVMLSLAELLYKAGKVEEGRQYFESMQKILKEQKNR